jgi:Icc protein
MVEIAQITDTHLFADSAGRLLGLDTRRSLAGVVELALRRGSPDLVVASGDLAHDGSPAAYRSLRDSLSALNAPVYCLPGNHDQGTQLREHLNGDGFHCCADVRTANGWQLVFLDSTVAGSDGGRLSASELARLEDTLAADPHSPTLVWLHHQPLPVGSAWLDTMAVENGDELLAILSDRPQVRAVVWGHVHQEVDRDYRGVRLLASPSTCIQFEPGSEAFAVDDRTPGYRWLRLHDDGTLESGVERLAEMPGTIDLSSRGY